MLKHLIRVGTVSNRNPGRCAVRVIFDDLDRLVSDWLPVVVPQALHTRDMALPDIGETVVCLFLGTGVESGFCLGAVYAEAAPAGSGSERGVWFPDGSSAYYDREAGELHVAAKSSVVVKAPSVTIDGDARITGSLSVEGDLLQGGDGA